MCPDVVSLMVWLSVWSATFLLLHFWDVMFSADSSSSRFTCSSKHFDSSSVITPSRSVRPRKISLSNKDLTSCWWIIPVCDCGWMKGEGIIVCVNLHEMNTWVHSVIRPLETLADLKPSWIKPLVSPAAWKMTPAVGSRRIELLLNWHSQFTRYNDSA